MKRNLWSKYRIGKLIGRTILGSFSQLNNKYENYSVLHCYYQNQDKAKVREIKEKCNIDMTNWYNNKFVLVYIIENIMFYLWTYLIQMIIII